MDAPTAIRVGSWRLLGSPVSLKLARAVASSLLLLLALAALLICIRRTTGALDGALPDGVLLACGAILAGSALVFRGLWFDARQAASRQAEIALWAAPTAVIVLSACGLSSRDNSTASLVLLWGALAAVEVWSWRQFLQRVRAPRPRVAVAQHRGAEPAVSTPNAFADEPENESQEQMSQRFVRRRAENGSELMEGWVRVDFVPGQRHANAHIAICPPFVQTPQCFAEQMDGPSAEIKVAQVLPYGVRCEIKLDEPVEEFDRVTVEFSIQESPAEE